MFTDATATTAHAEGYNTKAQANYAHSEGYGTIASNTAAHAEGYNTTASGFFSHSANRNTGERHVRPRGRRRHTATADAPPAKATTLSLPALPVTPRATRPGQCLRLQWADITPYDHAYQTVVGTTRRTSRGALPWAMGTPWTTVRTPSRSRTTAMPCSVTSTRGSACKTPCLPPQPNHGFGSRHRDPDQRGGRAIQRLTSCFGRAVGESLCLISRSILRGIPMV